MITLRVFGPMFGLPDPSPFVTKAEVLLDVAESRQNLVDYRNRMIEQYFPELALG